MYQEFYVARIDEIDSMGMEIAAKCRREAAKLYGLLLKHHSLLKHLGRTPCLVKIVLKGMGWDLSYGMLEIKFMLNVLLHPKE